MDEYYDVIGKCDFCCNELPAKDLQVGRFEWNWVYEECEALIQIKCSYIDFRTDCTHMFDLEEELMELWTKVKDIEMDMDADMMSLNAELILATAKNDIQAINAVKKRIDEISYNATDAERDRINAIKDIREEMSEIIKELEEEKHYLKQEEDFVYNDLIERVA